MDAAVVDGLRSEAKAAEGRALARGRDDFEFTHEQAAHRVDIGHVAESGVFAAEIFHAGSAADTPFSGTLFFEDVAAGIPFAANLANDLFEDVVNGDEAGGAAE